MKRMSPEFLGELPPSDKPWEMRRHQGMIIMVNQDHPPHVIRDGRLVPLELGKGVMTATEIVIRPVIDKMLEIARRADGRAVDPPMEEIKKELKTPARIRKWRDENREKYLTDPRERARLNRARKKLA
ncbi:MAG: hypothetical protein U1E51_23315 [Candidatus Binatia bacterium]|nr:hypothetical protein [Candidatus Binatia bacterium]